jgi:hypothetical protein
MEVVLVAGARGHFLALSFIVRLVTQPQYVVLPELRPTSLASIGIVTGLGFLGLLGCTVCTV